MAEMTLQVQRAIKQMRKSGFARNEFSVRVVRNWRTDRRTGQCYVEYGDAIVSLGGRNAEDKARGLTDAIIATGLGVIHYKLQSGYVLVVISTDYEMRGRFVKVDAEQRAREAEAVLAECEARRIREGWTD